MNTSKLFALTATLVCVTSLNSVADELAQLVSVDQVKIEKVTPTIWLPGNVISRENAPISAEQMGQLLWVVDVGTKIEAGQIIAKIDNRHLKLQLAQQQTRVKQQQAGVAYLEKQKQRLTALNAKNNTALSELEMTEKDLIIAQTEVEALKLLVKQTELAIEKTQVIAPFSGYISERFVHFGELISIGRPLVQLVNTSALDIQIAAPITLANFLSVDAKINVKWQDKLMELSVRTWSRAADQSSRTFDVRLSADNVALLPGTAVTVSLPKNHPTIATLVPRDALMLREKETFILKVTDEDTAQKVLVLVGQGSGDWIAVTGDIAADDEVIIRGGERILNGQKVRKGEKLIAKTE